MPDRIFITAPFEVRFIANGFALVDAPADGTTIALALPAPLFVVSVERMADALAAWQARTND